MVFLLLPALIFIAIIGWCMYWGGEAESAKSKKRKAPKKDDVTIMPIPIEESPEVQYDR